MKESPDDIMRKLMFKHKLDEKVVNRIISHPFRFVSKTMRSGATDKTIMIPYFGKFQVKPWRLKKLKENGKII